MHTHIYIYIYKHIHTLQTSRKAGGGVAGVQYIYAHIYTYTCTHTHTHCRHLGKLAEVSLEYNRLAYLPAALWTLSSLHTLSAAHNQIEWLSPGVTRAGM